MIVVPQDVNAWTARPTRLDEVASMLRFAAERHRTVLPCGGGSKIGWRDAPTTVEMLISSSALTEWRYEPGADTVTVGAGVPVAVAQARLAAFGRRLPIDPASFGATIGGVLATDEAGPLSELYGTPVETMLGAWGVRAGGVVVSVGEAHPDLAPHPARRVETDREPHLRWLGTTGDELGVLANATFRVTRIPSARRWITCVVGSPAEAFDLVAQVRARHVAPSAIELDLPASGPGTISVLLEGALDSCTERAAEVTAALPADAHCSDLPPLWWGRYPWRADDLAMRFSAEPATLRGLAYTLRDAVGSAIALRGSLGMGVLHASLPARLSPELIRGVLHVAESALIAREGRAIVLSAPSWLSAEVAPFRM